MTHIRKCWALAMGVTLVIGLSAGNLHAGIVDNANLVSPAVGAPGWYDPAIGIPNGGFTVFTSGLIELGLRAKIRQDPNIIQATGNVYSVPAGRQVATQYHAADPTRATWNFEFSIDLGPGGTGLRLSDITATLAVTDLTGTGGSQVFNAFFGDNSEYGSTGRTHENASPDQTQEWATQNSENPLFFPALFNDIDTAQTYQFTLTVKDLTSNVLASDTILVESVEAPEPGAFQLMGLAALGLGLARRRFQRAW